MRSSGRLRARRGIDPLAGSKRGRKSSKYTQLIFFDQPSGGPSLQEKQIHSDPVVERSGLKP
jgi:hypothetical protein